MSWLFGAGKAAAASQTQAEKEVDLKEKQREWQHKLQHQQRDLDKSIREIEREEAKVKLAIKKAVKDKQLAGAKALARNIVMSGKEKERLVTCKVHLEGIGVQLKVAMATLKVTGTLAKSGEIMKSMNALLNAAETSATTRELAQELARFGIIEEMMGEQLDAALDPDGDLDELADGEVEALVQEIVSGVKATAGNKKVPVAQAEQEHAAAADLERRMAELGE
jgi:charged multivesicular body protein 3